MLKLNVPPKLPKPNSEAIKLPATAPNMPKMMFNIKELSVFIISPASQPISAPNNSQSNIDIIIKLLLHSFIYILNSNTITQTRHCHNYKCK